MVATTPPPFRYLRLPDDLELLAAVGRVALRHGHLELILRRTVKTLTEVSVEEGDAATARDSPSALRKRIKTLARRRLGECQALVKLQALLHQSERVTRKRNDFLHGYWAHELDGSPGRVGDDGWSALPTVAQLDELAKQIELVTNTLNAARLDEGFLSEALKNARNRP
jgi:hypothetical protein